MMERRGFRLVATALVAVCLAGSAMGQQNGPQAPQPGQPAMRPFGGGRGFGMRMDSARILPPGLWWKDQDLVARLELSPDQQKRIDDAFLQNRVALSQLHASLDGEQLVLEPMMNANPIDQARVLAEIGKIADMRAELEKATAKMLLQIRGVLTQAQWTRLQQERPSGTRHHMYPRGPFGPQGRMDGPPPPQP